MPNSLLSFSGQAILLDKTTDQRISYAQIINNKGAVVGTTDIDGNLPQDLNDEVVTIQHIAYSPKSVKSSLFKEDATIYLNPIEYQLNDSCMKYFRDGYLDFFIDTKHKDAERLAIKIRNFHEKILEVVGLQGFAFICQIVWRCGRDSNPRPRA